MTEQGIVVLGIPIPSSSPAFVATIAIHVAAGFVCTVAGVVAMLAPKLPGRHHMAGSVYYWALVVVFLTMSAFTILRWPANNHLFVLGLGSFLAGSFGRRARRHLRPRWAPRHVTGMGLSYILLLTAFYVDNGPYLPVWRSLPRAAHWVVPTLIGLPILGWVLLRHPLIVGRRHIAGSEAVDRS